MDTKNINTKTLYAHADLLNAEAKKYYDDIENAWFFRNDGFMSDEQYAALCADREKKAAPLERDAKLLHDFAFAVDAQLAAADGGDAMSDFMLANAKPLDSFDLEAVKAAANLAAGLADPAPC